MTFARLDEFTRGVILGMYAAKLKQTAMQSRSDIDFGLQCPGWVGIQSTALWDGCSERLVVESGGPKLRVTLVAWPSAPKGQWSSIDACPGPRR